MQLTYLMLVLTVGTSACGSADFNGKTKKRSQPPAQATVTPQEETPTAPGGSEDAIPVPVKAGPRLVPVFGMPIAVTKSTESEGARMVPWIATLHSKVPAELPGGEFAAGILQYLFL